MPGDYLASVLLGALAIMLGAEAYQQYRRAARAERWPTVGGRVTSAELVEGPMLGRIARRTSHRAAIAYAYDVAGRTWSGTRVFFGDNAFVTGEAPYQRVEQYEPGSSVQVYYNPEDPSDAVLEPRAAWRVSARRAMTWGAIAVLSAIVVHFAGRSR